jgi:GDP-D-mannose dehydratase
VSRRALICGVSGQDGTYLARLLLDRGYHVTGTSRDAQVASFANLSALGIRERVTLDSMVLTDFRSTLQTLAKTQPDEVYNLAGQSSVGLSFQQPVETMESIGVGVLNLLEVIRFLGRDIRLSNASSNLVNASAIPAVSPPTRRLRSNPEAPMPSPSPPRIGWSSIIAMPMASTPATAFCSITRAP